jgi:hypothetical protein
LILNAGPERVVRVFVVGQDWALGNQTMRAIDPPAADMGMLLMKSHGVVEMFENSTVPFRAGHIGVVTTERLCKLSDWIQDWASDPCLMFAESWRLLRDRLELKIKAPGPFNGELNVFDLTYSTYKDNLMVRGNGQVVVADVFPPDIGDSPPVEYDNGQPAWTSEVWSSANRTGQDRGLHRMDLIASIVRNGTTSVEINGVLHKGTPRQMALVILENRDQFARLKIPNWNRIK